MKRGLLILAAVVPAMAWAQEVKHDPHPKTPEGVANAFAVQAPDEGSPFFSVREDAEAVAAKVNGPKSDDSLAVYPKVKNSPSSASYIFGKFFTDMFASVKIGSLHSDPSIQTLTITPIPFSVPDRRDLDTKYAVVNNTGKMVRLIFPTSQRIDIVTHDAAGNPIDKWSDDRAFTEQEGIVIINPKERIEYNETVPTRDMKAGQTYNIQADVLGYPSYTVTKPVTPNP